MRNVVHKRALFLCLAASLAAPIVASSSAQRPATRKCGNAPADLASRDAFVPQTSQKTERFRAYVLHLTDGRKVRVQARPELAGWEVRPERKTQPTVHLAADVVQRAQLESDLRKEAKRLKAAAGRNQPTRRAAFAEWLLEQGLVAEGLAEVDALLRADPDLEAACRVLERANIRVGLPAIEAGLEDPAQLEAFLRAAAASTRAGREIAAQRLAKLENEELLRESLLAELAQRDARRRAFATLGLRRALPGKAAQPLLSRALLDPSAEVRNGASLGLRACKNAAVSGPIISALASQHGSVRTHAADALGTMGYAAAVQPLVAQLTSLSSAAAGGGAPHSYIQTGRQRAYVQGFDVEVASSSSIADPIVNVLSEGEVLDVAVLSSRSYSIQTERVAIRKALTRLTGADPGSSTRAWTRWWKENADKWSVPKSAPNRNPTSRAP